MSDVRAVVYSDPNCPFCHATEERLHAIGLADRVQWRGVQHAPQLPTPMAAAAPAFARELEAEVAAVRRLAPEVPIELPAGKPNTALAIDRAAAALRTDPVAGRRFVRSLYTAFWVDGADLGDGDVLDALALAAGVRRSPPDEAAIATAAAWRGEWADTGLPGVPLLTRSDGRALYGLVGAEELRAFLAGNG